MARAHLKPKGQSPKIKAFSAAYAATGDKKYAAEKAGYSHASTEAQRLLSKPHVQESVRRIQERRIINELMPAALDLLAHVIAEPTFKPEVRVKAAAEVRQWYGQVTGGDGKGDKAPEDMTPDELQARIAALRARQAQLADGAKIIEGEAVTVDAAPIDQTAAADLF